MKKTKSMKCGKCGSMMPYGRLKFNEHDIDGWKCNKCGEIYYNPEQAQRILLLNKLRKESIRAKLGKVRSNLILRLPRDIENAYGLEKGEDVLIRLEDEGFKIVPV